MVYGITPQTSSGEENHRQYRETPPVLDYYGLSPKVMQTPALFTSAIQGTSAFVVPAKKALTQVSDTDKESVSGRAPLLLTPAFEEAKVEKPLVRADILTPTKLTKDGNPAVIVKTDSWYDAYKTQYFAVDKVKGTIYAIKEDGQWELTEEIATIDAETHHILMSTTPLAGNKMGRQSLSTEVTPGNKTEDSLPLAESTRTPGHQRIYPRDKDLIASAQRKRTIDNLSGQLMRDLIDEAMQEEQDFIIQELKAAEEAEQKALQEAQALKKQQFQLKLQLEAEQKVKQEEARLQLEHEQRQKLLEEEEKKLAEQKRITAELKLQKEKERLEREELEKQLEYAKQREAAIEHKFRDRLSSVGSDKSLKEASIGKLTERQIAGAQIKRALTSFRRITEAFKYVQATGTKVSDETLQRYEQIKKKIARELRLCLRFLQAEQEEVLEEKSSSPTKPEGDQQVPSHSPIPWETVSPIGKDTIPPSYKVTTPPLNGKSMGPTLSESLRERADALYKTHTIANGYGLQSTPLSLETLSKQFIAKSDKKSLKVPINTTPQLNEFLLHYPGIIEPDKLDWDYEDDQQSHDGSYSPIDHKKTMTTPQTSPLDLSTSKRSNITVPSAPMNTPRRGTVNIREANWRQGRSNIQSASDILKGMS